MKLKQFKCPNCNAVLNPDFNQVTVKCDHCDSKFPISYFKQKKKKNKNIQKLKVENTYTESKYIHTRHTDDAEVIKAQTEAFGTKITLIFSIIFLALFFVGMPVFFWIDDKKYEKKSRIIKSYCN